MHGKYKGTLLTAKGENVEDYIFPYAFSIVEDENKGSSLWFLNNVYKILGQAHPMYIISDRF